MGKNQHQALKATQLLIDKGSKTKQELEIIAGRQDVQETHIFTASDDPAEYYKFSHLTDSYSQTRTIAFEEVRKLAAEALEHLP